MYFLLRSNKNCIEKWFYLLIILVVLFLILLFWDCDSWIISLVIWCWIFICFRMVVLLLVIVIFLLGFIKSLFKFFGFKEVLRILVIVFVVIMWD